MVRLRCVRLHGDHDRKGLLPAVEPDLPVAGDLRHLRRGVPGPPDRWAVLRAVGGPHRPYPGARHHDDPDGDRDVLHRPHSQPRHHRSGGADPAVAGPAGPGLLDRRRVRRCHDVHRRVRAGQAPRIPGQLSGVRHADRLHPRRRHRRGTVGGPVGGGPAVLGLAHPIPGRRSAGRRGHVPEAEAGGDTGFRQADGGTRGTGRQNHQGGVPGDLRQALARDAGVRSFGAGVQRDQLHAHRLHADLPVRRSSPEHQ